MPGPLPPVPLLFALLPEPLKQTKNRATTKRGSNRLLAKVQPAIHRAPHLVRWQYPSLSGCRDKEGWEIKNRASLRQAADPVAEFLRLGRVRRQLDALRFVEEEIGRAHV